LNPVVYHCLRGDTDFLHEAQQLIVLKCQDTSSSSFVTTSSCDTSITSTTSNQTPKALTAIQSFFTTFEVSLPSNSTLTIWPTSFTIEQEIGMYISSIGAKTDFQEYWKTHEYQLPKLSRLARSYCTMTATSVDSESAFSVAGYIQRK
jgi:hAT family C-terminal dimerisation region